MTGSRAFCRDSLISVLVRPSIIGSGRGGVEDQLQIESSQAAFASRLVGRCEFLRSPGSDDGVELRTDDQSGIGFTLGTRLLQAGPQAGILRIRYRQWSDQHMLVAGQKAGQATGGFCAAEVCHFHLQTFTIFSREARRRPVDEPTMAMITMGMATRMTIARRSRRSSSRSFRVIVRASSTMSTSGKGQSQGPAEQPTVEEYGSRGCGQTAQSEFPGKLVVFPVNND